MKRLILLTCISSWVFGGIAAAQPIPVSTGGSAALSPVKSVAPASWNTPEPTPPAPPTPVPPVPAPSKAAPAPDLHGSPGELYVSPPSRAHELHLMQTQAAAESVHRAAVARAEQRTHRLESQRWFGISTKRPMASADPCNGDYSAYWSGNYPFYPMRWVGSGQPWGFAEIEP
jgi:hypothetical protein